MKILIFKSSPIGDTVMLLPVVQALRRMKPDWRITVLTAPSCAALFSPFMDAADIWVEDRSILHRSWRRPSVLFGWLRRVRRLRPDAVLLSFDQSSMARILAAASGAPLRIGGAESVVNWRHGLTHEVAIRPGHTLAEWEWEMARVLAQRTGLDWPETPPPPQLYCPRAHSTSGRRRVAIHPGASRAYQFWGMERFARLAERLATDCDVTWVLYPGGPKNAPNAPVIRAMSADISEFIALAGASDLFVGNHSGPFHLASAAGTPCVIPTGPTLGVCDPPWATERNRILRMPGLACMPCDKLIVSPNRCTNTGTPMACMDYWTVDKVERECRSVLGLERGYRS